MSKATDTETLWKGRECHAWFEISFSKYRLTSSRFYQQHGLLKTHYDETPLYKIIDICLERSLGQKIFGTGTITLVTKADSQPRITLRNIKHPLQVKDLLIKTIEEERERKHVIGKEFYGEHTSSLNHGDDDFDAHDDFDDYDDDNN